MAAARGGHPPLPLLRLLYACTTNLEAFLGPLLDERDRATLVTETDPPAFRELLQRTVVALEDDYKAPSRPWRTLQAAEAAEMKGVRLSALALLF